MVQYLKHLVWTGVSSTGLIGLIFLFSNHRLNKDGSTEVWHQPFVMVPVLNPELRLMVYAIVSVWSQDRPNKKCGVFPFTLWEHALLPQSEAKDSLLGTPCGVLILTLATIATNRYHNQVTQLNSTSQNIVTLVQLSARPRAVESSRWANTWLA